MFAKEELGKWFITSFGTHLGCFLCWFNAVHSVFVFFYENLFNLFRYS